LVAYNFKRQFVGPIRVGLGIADLREFLPDPAPHPKTHTIRDDRKRHARPGEEVQLYCGMRRKGCFLIGRGVCTSVRKITMNFAQDRVHINYLNIMGVNSLDKFARSDGFCDWAALRAFWAETHDSRIEYTGRIINWKPKVSPNAKE